MNSASLDRESLDRVSSSSTTHLCGLYRLHCICIIDVYIDVLSSETFFSFYRCSKHKNFVRKFWLWLILKICFQRDFSFVKKNVQQSQSERTVQKNKIIISPTVADSIIRLNFIVRFEKEVCKGGDNVTLIVVILFFLLSQSSLTCPVQFCNTKGTIFVLGTRKLRVCQMKERPV